jgi:hypothetical protein
MWHGLCTVEAMKNTALYQDILLKRTFDCGARSRLFMTKEMLVFTPLEVEGTWKGQAEGTQRVKYLERPQSVAPPAVTIKLQLTQ